MFPVPVSQEDWNRYRITDEQISFFHENGYLAGIRILEDWQVDQLNSELPAIMDASHPRHDLLYEFHSNESTDPSKNTVSFTRSLENDPGVS